MEADYLGGSDTGSPWSCKQATSQGCSHLRSLLWLKNPFWNLLWLLTGLNSSLVINWRLQFLATWASPQGSSQQHGGLLPHPSHPSPSEISKREKAPARESLQDGSCMVFKAIIRSDISHSCHMALVPWTNPGTMWEGTTQVGKHQEVEI